MRTTIALLVAALPASAAGVQGIVEDPSGRPVEGARIVCSGRSAVTDSTGSFSIHDLSRCLAVVSAPGFEEARLVLEEGRETRIRLTIAGVTERILVSAVRGEMTPEEAGVSASIVKRDDLEYRQFPMFADMLREIPALHVTRFGRQGSETQVFARGAQRTGTLVMIDGMPVNDPGGELNFAHFTTGDIERVEVVRGPESSLFGAEAAAGVIQIFTRRGDPERKVPRGSFTYERGNFKTDRWMTSLSGGSGDRIDYSLSAEQFHTAGEFPNDFYRNTTGTANVGFRLSSATQIRGVYRGYDGIGGSPNRVGYGIIDYDANRENRRSTASLRIDDVRSTSFVQRAILGYSRSTDRFNDAVTDGPYTVAALVRDSFDSVPRVHLVGLVDPSAAAAPPGTRLVVRTTELTAFPGFSIVSRTMADYQGTWAHSGGSLIFGYEYERQAGNISQRDVDRNNHGIFVHKQHSVGRVSLSGGVRLERNSVFGTRLTPRAAAGIRLFGEHGPLSSTFLRVSAGRGITEPTLLQVFAQEGTYIGNPNLRVERTDSFEVGLVQEWFGRRLRTEIAAYQNSFRDLIVFIGSTPPALGTWDNIDASRARGLEFIAQSRFLRYFTLSGNYTLLSTKITAASIPSSISTGLGQELLRRPRHSGSVSLSIAPRRWWFHAGAFFMGERQDSDLFGVNRNPGYQNVYAGGSYRLNRFVQPFFRADNLLNTRYQEVLGYSNLSRSLRGGLRLEW